MKQVWKKIEGFNYEISSEGEVRKIDSLKKVALCFDKNGYLLVNLRSDNKSNTRRVHRLVAEAFIPNPDGKPEVNHKNEVKTDNRDLNLEWVTTSENCNFGKRNRKISESKKKPVLQIDMNENIVDEFNSIAETEKEGFNVNGVAMCCRGERKSHGGYKWKFKTKQS